MTTDTPTLVRFLREQADACAEAARLRIGRVKTDEKFKERAALFQQCAALLTLLDTPLPDPSNYAHPDDYSRAVRETLPAQLAEIAQRQRFIERRMGELQYDDVSLEEMHKDITTLLAYIRAPIDDAELIAAIDYAENMAGDPMPPNSTIMKHLQTSVRAVRSLQAEVQQHRLRLHETIAYKSPNTGDLYKALDRAELVAKELRAELAEKDEKIAELYGEQYGMADWVEMSMQYQSQRDHYRSAIENVRCHKKCASNTIMLTVDPPLPAPCDCPVGPWKAKALNKKEQP